MRMPTLAADFGKTFIQRSFAAGEIAPALYARADLVKYATGLKTCRNFFIQKEGGASNRAGTEYIAEVKDSSKATRLLPFIFNDSQTYALEFGDQYMRVFRSGAAVVVSGVAAWSGATAYVASDLVVEGGVNYYCILAHTNQQPPNATYWYALTGDIYEIPTPYVEADLFDLRFVQSADVITICHPSYAPRDLTRSAHTTWTLTALTFAPGIAAPSTPAVGGGTGTGFDYKYVVTAVADETFEESLPSSAATLSNKGAPTDANPNTFTWAAVSGAVEYNVYKQRPVPAGGTFEGIYGYIGTTTGTQFNDNNVTPDLTDTPPAARNPFNASNDYPSCVTYVQQRRAFGNTNNDTEKVWASRSGLPVNMTISSPLQDDDAVTFVVRGKTVNSIQHMVELTKPIVFTNGAEWVIDGDASGIIVPGGVNPRIQSYHGSGSLPPIVVGSNALFVQARGNIVRDLKYEFVSDQFAGNDLGIFSSHLLKGHTIDDWAYAENPESIVWLVRDDGILLGLTYVREHQVSAWHRHDTYTLAGQSLIESAIAIPEGTEDAVYLVVNRTINGSTVRYVERMHSRRVSDIESDAFFVDSGLTSDLSTQAGTLTISGGTNWTNDENLTATLAGAGITLDSGYVDDEFVYEDTGSAWSAAAAYVEGDVVTYGGASYICVEDNTNQTPTISDPKNDERTILNSAYWEEGTIKHRFKIKEALTGSTATVNPARTVPAALRAAALSGWQMARKDYAGLDHLEGETVSILSDGNVEAPKTVSSGAVSLDNPGVVVHIGLPIQADLETLDLDVPGETSLKTLARPVNKVIITVQESRGIMAGPDADRLSDYEQRDILDRDETTPLLTGDAEITVTTNWQGNGRVFIRQDDPLPLNVLAIIPSFYTG